MSTTSETGHAKNVANFQDLIAFCIGYGAAFNPANANIKLTALNTEFTDATAVMDAYHAALPPYINGVNIRESMFAPLAKFATRILNAAIASAMPAGSLGDVRGYVRKLQGRRASPKLPDVKDDPATPQDESHKSASSSQMSIDSRIENLDKLIQLLASLPGYNPNEADLKITALQTLLASMKAANLAVATAYTALSTARIARNKKLYDPIAGLVTIAAEVKSYVKSVFGATSPQFKQISKVKFTRFKP